MKILVSACLLGVPCRYDGAAKASAEMAGLLERHTCIPICPEQLGGLSTPRLPSERRGDGVFAKDGADVTAQFRRGAEVTLQIARLYGCQAAVLKEKSPSCGAGVIHNGRFDGGLVDGDGVAAALLAENGIPVYGESRIGELLAAVETTKRS